MSAPNVSIRHFKKGKLVQEVETHNVWVSYGRQMLAEIVSELPPAVAPTPQRDERLRYFGLGIGGQFRSGQAANPPLSTAYPPGSAEYCGPDGQVIRNTTGDEYNQASPLDPLIKTLELPIRVSGSSAPYPGQAGDKWLVEPPELFVTHFTTQELTVHVNIDCTAGDYIYGPFTTMPVTEAGLFTNVVSPTNAAYQQLVAYVGFGTLVLDATSKVEFVWRVRFA